MKQVNTQKGLSRLKNRRILGTSIGILLILGGCVFLWWFIQPRLLAKLPDYPKAVLLKEIITEKEELDARDSNFYLKCQYGDSFGSYDYRVYMSQDSVVQIRDFYHNEAVKEHLAYYSNDSYLSYKELPAKNGVSRYFQLKNSIDCLQGYIYRELRTSNVIMFLDPQIPDEAEIISFILPEVKVKGIVFVVMRGFQYH